MNSGFFPFTLFALHAAMAAAQEPVPTGTTEGDSNNHHRLIFIISVSVVCGCMVLGAVAFLFWKLCRQKKKRPRFATCGDISRAQHGVFFDKNEYHRKKDRKKREAPLSSQGRSVVVAVPTTTEQFLGSSNSNNRNSGVTDFSIALDTWTKSSSTSGEDPLGSRTQRKKTPPFIEISAALESISSGESSSNTTPPSPRAYIPSTSPYTQTNKCDTQSAKLGKMASTGTPEPPPLPPKAAPYQTPLKPVYYEGHSESV